jgi:hypothetical protein|tara:strand:- start:585 stop:794 length:210 start_codon:yes stop_codon:yes gene_type:complete
MPIGEAVQDILLMNFFWNWLVYAISVGKLIGCNNVGLWGLFWYNDNGEMMNNCVLTGPVGAQAEYILPE